MPWQISNTCIIKQYKVHMKLLRSVAVAADLAVGARRGFSQATALEAQYSLEVILSGIADGG